MGGGRKPLKIDKDGETSTNANNQTSQQDVHKVETRIEEGELSDTSEPAIVPTGDMKPHHEIGVNIVQELRFSNPIASNGAKNVDSIGDANMQQFVSSASRSDASDQNFRHGRNTVENVREKEPPTQAELPSNSIPTNEKKKIEPNASTDLSLKTSVNLPFEDSPWTATVFIAAPFVKNHYLAITGEDQNLGKWKQPQGKFESIFQINKDLHIFKGIVPIPSRYKMFKFVDVNMAEQKIEYEGDGPMDNRSEELLPDSWNFFIFKPKKAKSMMGKFWEWGEGLAKYVYKRETKESIAREFFSIVFNSTLENIIPGNTFCTSINRFHNYIHA
jgi:hypothetical protein